MKKLAITITILLAMTSVSSALTVLDFENIPQNHWYYEGGENLGGYYDGIVFGPDATILEDTYGFEGHSVPTHSGDAVLFSSYAIGIQTDWSSFANHVEFYYTSFGNIYVFAYDENWNLLDSSQGGYNSNMTGYLEVSSNEYNIAHVRIGRENNLPFIIDDLGFEFFPDSQPVPEPSTVLLLATGLLGMAGYSRLRKRK